MMASNSDHDTGQQLNQYIQQYMIKPSNHIIQLIVQQIVDKQITVSDVVESNTQLRSNEFIDRQKALQLLSDILLQCENKLIFDQTQLKAIVTYYLTCLLNRKFIKETVAGLYALVKYHVLNPSNNEIEGMCPIIINEIYVNVNVQSCMQSTRGYIFDIMTLIAQKRVSTVISMGEDFIEPLIESIDGEKDPRCLLSIFNLLQFILINMHEHATSYAQRLFDVTSCYFPITFTSRSSEHGAVTGDQLRDSLRHVLTCTSEFIDYLIPLLVDTLESNAPAAKIDTLQTLTECLNKYSIHQLDPYLQIICNRVQGEIFHSCSNTTDEVEMKLHSAADHTLAALVNLLCKDTIDGFNTIHISSKFDHIFKQWLIDSGAELWISDSKLARQHAVVLINIATVSHNSFTRILYSVWPTIKRKYNDVSCQLTQKIVLLELIRNLVVVAKKGFTNVYTSHPLNPYVDEVLDMLYSILLEPNIADGVSLSDDEANQPYQIGANEDDFEDEMGNIAAVTSEQKSIELLDTNIEQRCISLITLANLCTTINRDTQHGFMTDEQINGIVRTATNKLFVDPSVKVQQYALDSLVILASVYADQLLSITLPQLFNDDFIESVTNGSIDQSNNTLHTVSMLARASAHILDHCLPYLIQIILSQLPSAVHGHTNSLYIIYGVFNALITIVKPEINIDNRIGVNNMTATLSKILIDTLIESTQSLSAAQLIDKQLLSQCCLVLQSCAQISDHDTHKQLLEYVVTTYLLSTFTPFSDKATQSQQQLIILFSAIISSYRPQIGLPSSSIVQSTLLHYITSKESNILEASRSAAIHCSASILNKLPDTHGLDSFIRETIESTFLQSINNHTLTIQQRCTAIQSYVWHIKALVIRAHTTTGHLTQQLCHLLSLYNTCERLAYSIAHGYNIILTDYDTVLNKKCHARINPVYKQRFFCMALPYLTQQYTALHTNPNESVSSSHLDPGDMVPSSNNTTGVAEQVLLTALANMHKHIPNTVLLQHIDSTLPLLIQSLQSNNIELRMSALTIITRIIRENVQLIIPYLSTLMPILLQLVTYQPRHTVRLSSLACLDSLTQLSYPQLARYKQNVIKVLAEPLDDKKRIVRQAAIKCRGEWCILKA